MNIRREEQPELNAYETFNEIRRTIELDDKEFETGFLDDRAAPVANEEEFDALLSSFQEWNDKGNNPQEYAYHHDDDMTDILAVEQLLQVGSPQPLGEEEY